MSFFFIVTEKLPDDISVDSCSKFLFKGSSRILKGFLKDRFQTNLDVAFIIYLPTNMRSTNQFCHLRGLLISGFVYSINM